MATPEGPVCPAALPPSESSCSPCGPACLSRGANQRFSRRSCAPPLPFLHSQEYSRRSDSAPRRGGVWGSRPTSTGPRGHPGADFTHHKGTVRNPLRWIVLEHFLSSPYRKRTRLNFSCSFQRDRACAGKTRREPDRRDKQPLCTRSAHPAKFSCNFEFQRLGRLRGMFSSPELSETKNSSRGPSAGAPPKSRARLQLCVAGDRVSTPAFQSALLEKYFARQTLKVSEIIIIFISL